MSARRALVRLPAPALALVLLAAASRAQAPEPEDGRAPSEPNQEQPAGGEVGRDDTPAVPGAGADEAAEPDPVVIELLAPETGTHPDAPRLALDEPRAPAEIEAALATLAERYPGQLRVESLGRSAAGRPLPLAVLGAEAGAPAIFFGDRFDGAGGPRRRDVGLGLVDALLHRAQTDAALRELLGRATVYVAPMLAPGERAAAGGTRFDRNFPSGWQPEGIRPGSGPYPLSVAEARALHDFLLGHPAVAIAVGLSPAAGPGGPGASGAPSAPQSGTAASSPALPGGPTAAGSPGPGESPRPLVERVFARAAPAIPAAVADGPARGGWLDTCRVELGIDTLCIAPPGADVDALVPGVAALLACLPALELGRPEVLSLSGGMWQVDVTLTNPGRLPTRGANAPRRFAAGDVGASLAGGPLVAAAYRAPEAEGFRVLNPSPDGRVGVGELRGGEAGVLRLVFEAPAGADLTLSCSAPRAGGATLPIRLP